MLRRAHLPKLAAWLLLAAGFIASASAAPVGAEPQGNEPVADESAPAEAPLPPRTGNKSIDLLLQMRAAPPESTASAGAAGARTSAPLPPPPPLASPTPVLADQLKQAMLELGVRRVLPERAPDPQRDARMAEERQRREAQFGPTEAPRPSGAAGVAAGRGLLDLAVVRFIRENRWSVIGASVALLAAAYGAANFSMHRRRRRR